MKDVIPNDTRYIPLTQQLYHCVPTCVQMIMLRHNIPLVPAELLGSYLEMYVPDDSVKFFWKEPKHGSNPPRAGYGTQVYENDRLNKAFEELSIPLEMGWKLIENFEDFDSFKKYLETAESDEKDVLVCFDWGALFDKETSGQGHVCVLDKVYMDKNEVRIVDPGQKSPKWRVVDAKKLYNAMAVHGNEKSGGFWEFTTKQLQT